MKSILVTGGTGYIGSQFIKKFHHIYNFIILARATSNVAVLHGINHKVVYYSEYSELLTLLSGEEIEGVIHFASHIVTEHSSNDIQPMIKSNILLGTYLLELCKQYQIPWFVNTGTFWQHYHSNVYEPVNLYAATKEAFEKIADYYMSHTDFVFVTLKLTDIYGPNDFRNKVLALWYKMIKSQESLSMSLGEQIVDMVYIDDVLEAYHIIIDLLASKNLTNKDNLIYGVSSGNRYSLRHIAGIFEEVTQTKLDIHWGAKPYKERGYGTMV